MFKTIIGMAVAAAAPSDKEDKKQCYALAMSGGGTKGAFEAGALWGMYYATEDKSTMAYDVSTGVSAGAINTGGLALFAPGDEDNMLKALSDEWASLKTDNLYRNWSPLGPVSGIMSHTGILDTYPLG